ncbi:MAG: hypothetical protein HS104_19770 [Polyangiaceae bacterium]|nr:hypothetical protein [Polyangiaceae bacterium]MCE7888150.1 hypothetical protein [Sorangiineae bacterium PRO1]MCL4755602.1 hypothetical protein [Myxococcales bacterium]
MSPDELRRVAFAALCSERAEEELEPWLSFVRGDWSVVDQFDHDGRRYLIAERRRGQELISRAEWQMLAARARGSPLKVIAVEVGLSVSAVSRRIRQAMQKLGLRTQSELARLLARGPAYGPDR